MIAIRNSGIPGVDYGSVQIEDSSGPLGSFLAGLDDPASVEHWPVVVEYVLATTSDPSADSVDTEISAVFRGTSWAEWSDEVRHVSTQRPTTSDPADRLTCVVNHRGERSVFRGGCFGELERTTRVPTVESAPNAWIRARFGFSADFLRSAARDFQTSAVSDFDAGQLGIPAAELVLVKDSGERSCVDLGLECGAHGERLRWSQVVVIHGPTALPLYAKETLGASVVSTFEVIAFDWKP